MIAIISDVHGNYPALEAVLNEIDSIGCTRIISLGDVAGYYCMVNECIDIMRARRITNLLGNHDHYLLSGAGCPRSTTANRCIEFQNQVITEENRRWLEKSPLTVSLNELLAVHGGWNDPLEEYLYVISEGYFAQRLGEYFFSGHTHVQTKKSFAGKTYCNPGSVGQPRDGDPRAAFAIFNEGRITLKRVSYTIDTIASAMERVGFGPYYFENLYTGSHIGGGISTVTVSD